MALDLLDPKPDDIDLIEIGRALGNQCRYAGCVRYFYSVAEHSVLISEWLEAQGAVREVQLGGLLHDAAEAYTGDITWPVQSVLWGASEEARIAYKRMQGKLDDLVANACGISSTWLHVEAVKTADLRILIDERQALLDGMPRPWFVESEMGLSALGVEVQGWGPAYAARRWLHRLRDLGVAP